MIITFVIVNQDVLSPLFIFIYLGALVKIEHYSPIRKENVLQRQLITTTIFYSLLWKFSIGFC